MNNYSIYAHINKVNDKVYIGISNNIKHRWCQKEEGYKNCTAIYNAFKKYGWDGFEHIVFLNKLSKEDAVKLEKMYISFFKKGNMCYNITDGGEGAWGHKCSPEARMLMSIIKIEANKDPEYRRRTHCRHYEILQYTLNGTFVREFKNAQEAAKAVGCTYNNIISVANGKTNSAGGYYWKKKKDTTEVVIPKNKRKKAIDQLDMEGNYIASWESAAIAAKTLGAEYSVKGISKCCIGDLKSYKNYKWRFKNETV